MKKLSAVRWQQLRVFLSQHLLGICLGISLVCLIYQYYLRAVNYSLFFNELPIDGAFQLFNPLRRMAAGQVPGRDFQFFHGIGIVFLHYLPFVMFGGNLSASELTRWFVSPLLFLVVVLAFFLSMKVRKETTFFLFLIIEFGFYYVLGFSGIFYTGNSLLGVRSTMPILTFSILAWMFRSADRYQRTKQFFLFEICAALLAALSFFFSIEHGIATVVGMSLMLVFFPVEEKNILSRLSSWLVFAVWYGVFLFGIHFIATQGAVIQCLKYELLNVPSDQFWYFGAPPNPFLGGMNKIYGFKISLLRVGVALGVFLPILIYRYQKQRKVYKLEESLLLFLICYGLVSCIGYLGIATDIYTLPLARVELLIFLLFVVRSAAFFPGLYAICGKYVSWAKWSLAILFFIVVGIRFWKINYEYHLEMNSGNYSLQKVSGVYLNSEWWVANSIALKAIGPVGSVKNGQLWSTYAGLLETEYGVFHPDTDYVIHALGKERRDEYLQNFNTLKPEFVTTINHNYFQYEEWLMDDTWGMYANVGRFYQPIAMSQHRVIWRKKTDQFTPDSTAWSKAERSDDDFFVLRSPAQIRNHDLPMIEVQVKYQLHNPWQKLPYIGKLPRFLLYPINASASSTQAISLPPYETQVTFPLVLKKNADVSFRVRVQPGFPGANVQVLDVEYRAFDAPEERIKALLGKPFLPQK